MQLPAATGMFTRAECLKGDGRSHVLRTLVSTLRPHGFAEVFLLARVRLLTVSVLHCAAVGTGPIVMQGTISRYLAISVV